MSKPEKAEIWDFDDPASFRRWSRAVPGVPGRSEEKDQDCQDLYVLKLFLREGGVVPAAFERLRVERLVGRSRPDFRLVIDGNALFVEIVEATCPNERRRRAEDARNGPQGVKLVPEPGDDAMSRLIGQVERAIAEKAQRAYANDRCFLAIYMNSDEEQRIRLHGHDLATRSRAHRFPANPFIGVFACREAADSTSRVLKLPCGS